MKKQLAPRTVSVNTRYMPATKTARITLTADFTTRTTDYGMRADETNAPGCHDGGTAEQSMDEWASDEASTCTA